MMRRLVATAAFFLPLAAAAQDQPTSWQACTGLADSARLACFDAWARGQQPAPAQQQPRQQPVAEARTPPPDPCLEPPRSRLLWVQDPHRDCGLFDIRSYRPMSASVIASDSVNRQPSSENPLNGATSSQPFRTTETRLQMSMRVKLLDRAAPTWPDVFNGSLWFGYTQQSYWQVFTPDVSRPFRNTDHEPEAVYVLPLSAPPIAGWTLRYAGLGLVHQSNGQSLPFSRSWNRAYLMAGAERGGLTLHGRIWQRIDEDASKDDNPAISRYVGRAELIGAWTHANRNQVQLTWRNNLRDLRHGSLRAEWLAPMQAFTKRNFGSLNLHTQVFTGYGDSLIDYNRRRTVLSLGVSLVDW